MDDIDTIVNQPFNSSKINSSVSNSELLKEEPLHVESNDPLTEGQVIDSPNGPLLLLRMEGTDELYAVPCSRNECGTISIEENQQAVPNSPSILDEFVRFNTNESQILNLPNIDENLNKDSFTIPNNEFHDNFTNDLNSAFSIESFNESYPSDINLIFGNNYNWDPIIDNNNNLDEDLSDDSNASKPVYLNLNLFDESTGKENFGSEINQYNKEEIASIDYFEYIDQNGETKQAKYLNTCDNVLPKFETIKLQTNKITKRTNYANLTNQIKQNGEIIPIENINTNDITTINTSEPEINQLIKLTKKTIKKNFSSQNNLKTEKKTISKNPYQTKIKTSKNKLTNNDSENQKSTESELISLEKKFKIIDSSKIIIPIIRHSNVRRERKQSFKDIKILTEEVDKVEDTIMIKKTKKTDVKKIKDNVTKILKNKNSTNADDYSHICNKIKETALPNVPLRSSKRLLNNNNLYKINSDTSTDDDDDDINQWSDIINNQMKSMKCIVCLKLFKSSRSWIIHQKQCVPNLSFSDKPINDTSILTTIIKNPTKQQTIQKKQNKTTPDHNNNIEIISTKKIKLKSKINEKKNETDQELISNDKTCDICKKSFRHENHLRNHKKIHENSHKCQYCEKFFSFKNALDGHLKRCKKNTNI